MELSKLNTDIKASIEAIDTGTTEKPNPCGWLPAMRTRAGIVLADVKRSYPALIQYTDNHKESDMNNGVVRHEIDFYLVTTKPKGHDALQAMELHDTLSYISFIFYRNLRKYYNCEFIGQRERLVEQLPDLEAGLFFTMAIEVDRPCVP